MNGVAVFKNNAVLPRLALAAALTSLFVLTAGPARAGVVFTDGFEGPALEPFWTARQDSGSVSLSTTQVYAGAQSLQLSSTYNTGQKYIWVSHVFEQPVFGSVSAWMYDTGADEESSNYLGLELLNSVLGQSAALYTRDYDLGTPAQGGSYRWLTFDGTAGYAVDRTKAWHHLQVKSTPDQIVLAVDGQVVYTGVGGAPYDEIRLRMEGPSWRPAWVCYYDDFSFEEYTPTVTVAIDIKPGSDPNPIHLGSRGLIPVAILSTLDLDATIVNPETVLLAGAGVATQAKGKKAMTHEEDVNGDGLLDLLVQVETQDLDPEQVKDGTAVLTATTFSGVMLIGEDTVVLVPAAR